MAYLPLQPDSYGPFEGSTTPRSGFSASLHAFTPPTRFNRSSESGPFVSLNAYLQTRTYKHNSLCPPLFCHACHAHTHTTKRNMARRGAPDCHRIPNIGLSSIPRSTSPSTSLSVTLVPTSGEPLGERMSEQLLGLDRSFHKLWGVAFDPPEAHT